MGCEAWAPRNRPDLPRGCAGSSRIRRFVVGASTQDCKKLVNPRIVSKIIRGYLHFWIDGVSPKRYSPLAPPDGGVSGGREAPPVHTNRRRDGASTLMETTMNAALVALQNKVLALKSDRRGVTALEYGIIAGVLGLVLIAIFTTLGTQLTALFTKIGTAL